MYNNIILENGGMLMFIYDCHKNHKKCHEAVDYCSHALEFVLRLRKCAIKLSILVLLYLVLLLINANSMASNTSVTLMYNKI